MFRRAFWFTTGAAAGVWATTKVNRKLRSLTPESLTARAADKAVETGYRLRDFALDVRAGMAQREDELHDALGLDAPVDADHPALPAQAGPARPAPRLAKPRQAPQITRAQRTNATRTHTNTSQPHTTPTNPTPTNPTRTNSPRTTHPYDRKEDH
jgi:hypothetical protein